MSSKKVNCKNLSKSMRKRMRTAAAKARATIPKLRQKVQFAKDRITNREMTIEQKLKSKRLILRDVKKKERAKQCKAACLKQKKTIAATSDLIKKKKKENEKDKKEIEEKEKKIDYYYDAKKKRECLNREGIFDYKVKNLKF